MDGGDRRVVLRRPSLKERLGFNLKGLGCCGPTWSLGPTTMSVMVTDSDGEEQEGIAGPLTEPNSPAHDPVDNGPACAVQSHSHVTNLAAALAAERQLRAVLDSDIGGGGGAHVGTPGRVSLMRLLEDTDGCDDEEMKKGDGGGCVWVCCVCMGRKKGAAFIPCGHTFCRVCSRELWLNRGSCPLCNRPILEILDIY